MINSTNGTSSSFCKHWLPDSYGEKVAKETILVLLGVLGLVFNIFVIILAVKYTKRKNFHYLIINMAFSDSLFLLTSAPIGLSKAFKFFPSGTFGLVLCKSISFLCQSCVMVSLMTLLVISIERFRATRRTLQLQRPYTVKQRVGVLAVTWLIPMTPSIGGFYEAETNKGECFPFTVKNSLVIYKWFVVNILITSVIFVIFFLSIYTIRRLFKPQAINAHLSMDQQRKRARRTRTAVTMVVASAILYTVCWGPFFIFNAIRVIDLMYPSLIKEDYSACIDWYTLIFIMFSFFPPLNSFFSPWMYIIFLDDFRKAGKEVLCGKTNKVDIKNNEMELRQ